MKKVIITGGSRGIGAATVRRFTQAGATVAFIYRSDDSAAKALSQETGAFAVKGDISSPEQARSATEKCIELLGGVDVLVNNAGVALIKLFDTVTDEEWRKLLDTNLSGAFYVTRAVAKEMLGQKSGRIINIGSVWGRMGASCEVAYSASKAALRGFTLSLAKELGPSGITVNCIEPGVIATEMNSELDAESITALKDATPLCRLGEPTDVADAVLFLSGEGASFITGQVLGVDGGFCG